jgi:CubicO group peptidase (beta-lactamase class C family)
MSLNSADRVSKMRAYLRIAFLFWTLVRLCHGQNCPILGPAYPAVARLSSSPTLNVTKAAFEKALAQALSSGQFDSSTTSFSVQVFSTHDNEPIYEYYHTALSANASLSSSQVGPGTLYRIGSISKLVTVYTILSKLSDRYWNEPVTNYVPELAATGYQRSNSINNVEWSEVTLGALASQMGGIGRDCTCCSGYSFAELDHRRGRKDRGMICHPRLNVSQMPWEIYRLRFPLGFPDFPL